MLPPLAALVFIGIGRHPLIGMFAGYAGVAAGFSANIIVSMIDVLLAGFTGQSAQMVDPNYVVNPAMNMYFLAVSAVVLTILGSIVTEKYVAPRFGKYEGLAEDTSTSKEVTPLQAKGLKYALYSLLLVVIIIVILKIMLGSNKKIIMQIANNEKLNNIVKKLPENIDICKDILKKLRNNKVKIEEQENTNCFYFIATDKIILNKDKKYFTRVQTIAHECIHSTQNKKILWFNYIFANLLNIFWLIITILTITGVITQYALFSAIILICIIVFYVIRSYLEIEAMTKAKYIAKEYLEENQVKETDEIVEEYEKLNDVGIKYTCYKLISSKLYLLAIYTIMGCILNFIR